MIPYVIGALVSIPALFVATFVKQFKWLQLSLMFVASGLVVWGIVALIGVIPPNINIMGTWGSLFLSIQRFLNGFAKALYPFYCLTLMIVGGTLRIGSKLFAGDTFAYFGVMLACLAVALGLAYLLAKPLFIRMAARQFEFEKMVVPPKKNKVFNKKLSPVLETLQMTPALAYWRHFIPASESEKCVHLSGRTSI